MLKARCLLLDFDGPVCRLFAGHRAEHVAEAMRRRLARHGVDPAGAGFADVSDPLRILRALTDPAVIRELEALQTEEEERAALSAEPTPRAGEFVRTVAASGRLLAITTNNAPSAVATYLKMHNLDGCFGERVFGRSTESPALMKPDPDCLLRAVEALGARPAECLMIGDSPADAEAARAAGVPFLGYARAPGRRVARLREAHPHPVVVGMAPLVAAARGLPPL